MSAFTPAARFPLPSRTPTQRLPECIVILRATNGRGGAFHAWSKANFATPCKQICGVSAFTPAAFAPQSFLSPRCSVAVLYGDPVYGFRSRRALRHSDCANVLSFSVLPTVVRGASRAFTRSISDRCIFLHRGERYSFFVRRGAYILYNVFTLRAAGSKIIGEVHRRALARKGKK